MQIHIVQQNQSLYTIAPLYNSSAQAIAAANQLPNPNALVIGQALVIPTVGSFYWVQPGDSLYSIAAAVNTSYQNLADINGISATQTLEPGTRLYIPPRSKVEAEFNAYVEPRGKVTESIERSVREATPYLTYLSPFSFEATRDGNLKEPLLDDFAKIASQNNNILMMVITNKENDQFNADLAHILLTNEDIQNHFLSQIVATASKHGFKNIHFDFEFLKKEDREPYNHFLQKAHDTIKPNGWMISTALAPKTSDEQQGQWVEAHDYKAHGNIVDFVVIMSYEWGHSKGPAQAVSPIDQVRNVIKYAVSVIPAGKILMGQNLYGYDWTLPYVQGSIAKSLSPQAAIQTAQKFYANIQYNYEAQAPFFHYYDHRKKLHEVWFEDARSIQAKFNLLKEFKLRGISYWKLGLSFPQNWSLIAENFQVRKG